MPEWHVLAFEQSPSQREEVQASGDLSWLASMGSGWGREGALGALALGLGQTGLGSRPSAALVSLTCEVVGGASACHHPPPTPLPPISW